MDTQDILLLYLLVGCNIWPGSFHVQCWFVGTVVVRHPAPPQGIMGGVWKYFLSICFNSDPVNATGSIPSP